MKWKRSRRKEALGKKGKTPSGLEQEAEKVLKRRTIPIDTCIQKVYDVGRISNSLILNEETNYF